MSYNSKYKSSRIEELLDQAGSINITSVDINDSIDEVQEEFVTKGYVDNLVGDINAVLTSIINQ